MKIGIITFHNSYNCGSMMESFAMQTIIEKMGFEAEIINFSSPGQRELYAPFFPNDSIRNIVKNILLFPQINKIKYNNTQYEKFETQYFHLSKKYTDSIQIEEKGYDIVIAGSDQIWNITIKDYAPAYFLNWVHNAKKVAYAPSFGARKIADYTDNEEQYKHWLRDFDCLSIREKNGQKWLKEMLGIEVPVLLDPTLLLSQQDYESLVDKNLQTYGKYIFFYSPSFNAQICRFVQQVAKKYSLRVITWSTKNYYYKLTWRFGFEIPKYESPSVYLNLIENAELIFTTSYHGTIFSTIYRKKFFCIMNGDMFGTDDRVTTLLEQIGMMDRLIEPNIHTELDFLIPLDYSLYENQIDKQRKKSFAYLENALNLNDEQNYIETRSILTYE